MDVTHLQAFCTSTHNTLIELQDKNHQRWLFATDGHRAIGFQTTEYVSNIEDKSSSKARCVADLFQAERKYLPMKRQRFMAWLHSTEEKKECGQCQGSGRIPCSECDGDGVIECNECEGSGTCYDDCEECDGSGKKQEDCDECGGSGKDECDCDECGATGKAEHDCDECGGSGFEDDEETKECSGCTEGKVEGDCEYCTKGKIEDSCSYCEDGQVENDCEDCEDGRIERGCEDCDCGNTDCPECDSDQDHTQECDECDSEDEYRGRIHGQIFNLEFFKDLSMDFFDEIAPSTAKLDPLTIKGKGVMAFIMPMNGDAIIGLVRDYNP